MNFGRRKFIIKLITAVLCLLSKTACAVLFEPGVGIGLEYTDNVTLVSENEINDSITVGYVGGRLSENEGALIYDAAAAMNHHSYVGGTYPDKLYFSLGASADWEMIKERFNWFVSNYYGQRVINTLDSNTPDNLQDTNIFTFGADISLPVSSRQKVSIFPLYRQFYYEARNTNNRQYSIVANWDYNMFRLSSVGFSASTRYIDYIEQVISNTRFTNFSFVSSGFRQRSTYTIRLGSTNARRDNGEENTGFAGYLNWNLVLSSHSSFTTILSTNLTDTSTASLSDSETPGNGDDVQVTTDVIRFSIAGLSYNRDDAKLSSAIWMRYKKIEYSDNPLDRVIRTFGISATYPLTGLLSSGAYANYNHTEELDSGSESERYTMGGNLRYIFSRKINGLFDLKYRKKVSTNIGQNYDEFSVFFSLVYGYGDVARPTRTGGF